MMNDLPSWLRPQPDEPLPLPPWLLPAFPNVALEPHSIEKRQMQYADYLLHGLALCDIAYSPTRKLWKAPRGKQWTLTPCTTPPTFNCGLMHLQAKTCSIDIDNLFETEVLFAQRGLDIHKYLNAPDAVQIVSGRANSGKLLFKLPAPLRTVRVHLSSPKHPAFEFRCATTDGTTMQDLLPPSLHPSGESYRWGGAGDWRKLPELPIELMVWWMEITQKNDPTKNNGVTHATGSLSTKENSFDEGLVRQALASISADCDYHKWLAIGMALHSSNAPNAINLFWEWSITAPHRAPSQRTFISHWNSFKADGDTTIATLFHYAREAGWTPPPVDVKGMFSAVSSEDVVEVLNVGLPIPSLDIGLLPTSISDYACETASKVGCHVSVPISAAMTAICAATDSRSRLEIRPGFEVPPILWNMLIASPSAKKTPGTQPMFKPLEAIERDLRPAYMQAKQEFDFKEAAHAAALKDAIRMASKPEFMMNGYDVGTLPPIPELPKEPVSPRLVIQDATSQKMVRMAAERPEGMACILDEGAAWLKKMIDPKTGEDRSAWVVAYEGNRYLLDRAGDGSFICDNLAISLHMNVQPQVLRGKLRDLQADGLLQRFIPWVVPDNQSSRVGDKSVPAMYGKDYEGLLRLINIQGQRKLVLDSNALAVFEAFEADIERIKVEERTINSLDAIQASVGKLTGLAGRIAMIFSLAEQPGASTVTADIMARAIEFVRSYVLPGVRYTNMMADDSQSFDAWLADHLISGDEGEIFTLSELKRSSQRQFDSRISAVHHNDMLHASLALFEKMNWVRKIDESRKGASYAVNPDLHTKHAERRANVIKIKQARLDENRRIAEQATGRTLQQRYARGNKPQT